MGEITPISHDQLRRAVRQQLETLRRAGVRQISRSLASGIDSSAIDESLPRTAVSPASAEPHQQAPSPAPPAAVSQAPKSTNITQPSAPDGGLSTEDRVAELDIIRNEVAGCRRCQELANTRTQTVFGVGNPQARLVFCGEAPGADEDRQGEPFVGRAGQLLTKIIEACTLSREEVYILNVLKCRPPNNRNPLPTEVHNCRGFLDRQLEIIRPEYICCLGTVAAHTLLETTTPIGKLRGSFHDYNGIPVWCTYHPAYLLRNPPAKRYVWDDMKALMSTMGIDVEGARK